jgi:hypothetical protein
MHDFDPSLAQELKQLAHELDQASSKTSINQLLLLSEPSSARASQHHRRLAERWEQLVDNRSLPGQRNFLRLNDMEYLLNSNRLSWLLLPGQFYIFLLPLSLKRRQLKCVLSSLPRYSMPTSALAAIDAPFFTRQKSGARSC